MNGKSKLVTGILLTAATFIAGNSKADSLLFGLGITPRGTSFSIGYQDGRCTPAPPRHVERHCPPPPVEVVYAPPAGHYENRVERVWIEGYWTESRGRGRRMVRVWHPGYWEERVVRVWVRH